MEELIFFGVLILFSILDAVLKQRKRGRDADGLPLPLPEAEESWEERRPPSYWEEDDDVAVAVPPDVDPTWEEETRSRDEVQDVRRWEGYAWAEVGRAETTLIRLPSPSDDVHPVHRSHAGYGARPPARGGAGLPPPPRATTGAPMRPEVQAARDLLRSGGRPDLRTAMVLREILSPPISMRDEG